MAAKKTAATKVPANPTDVQWETDTFGFLTALRTEGLKAAGRVSFSDKKLGLYLQTIDTLREHVVARHARAVEDNKREMAARIAAQKAEAERKAREAEMFLRKQADDARKALEEAETKLSALGAVA